jgi:hypothetical protein
MEATESFTGMSLGSSTRDVPSKTSFGVEFGSHFGRLLQKKKLDWASIKVRGDTITYRPDKKLKNQYGFRVIVLNNDLSNPKKFGVGILFNYLL